MELIQLKSFDTRLLNVDERSMCPDLSRNYFFFKWQRFSTLFSFTFLERYQHSGTSMVSTSECFAHLEGDADLGNPELQQQQQIHTDKYWSMTVHVRLQQHFKRPHVIVGRWGRRGKGNQLFRICYVNVSSCALLLECMRHDHKWCLTVLGASWFYESNEPVQNWYCFPRAGNIRQRPGQNLNGWVIGFGYFLLSDSRGSICCLLDLQHSPASSCLALPAIYIKPQNTWDAA